MYDRIIAAACFTIAVVVLFFGLKMGGIVLDNPGPGFMPVLSASLIILFSILIFIRKRKNGETRRPFEGIILYRIVLTILILFAYGFILPWAGYISTTFVGMISLLLLIKNYPLTYVLGLSGFTAIFSFVIFNSWLEVSLPKGFWGF